MNGDFWQVSSIEKDVSLCLSLTFLRICAIIYYRNDVMSWRKGCED